jgi:hypothetical protein
LRCFSVPRRQRRLPLRRVLALLLASPLRDLRWPVSAVCGSRTQWMPSRSLARLVPAASTTMCRCRARRVCGTVCDAKAVTARVQVSFTDAEIKGVAVVRRVEKVEGASELTVTFDAGMYLPRAVGVLAISIGFASDDQLDAVLRGDAPMPDKSSSGAWQRFDELSHLPSPYYSSTPQDPPGPFTAPGDTVLVQVCCAYGVGPWHCGVGGECMRVSEQASACDCLVLMLSSCHPVIAFSPTTTSVTTLTRYLCR